MKDAFHRYLVNGETQAVNPAMQGTKVAAHYSAEIQPGASWTSACGLQIPTRRTKLRAAPEFFGPGFEAVFAKRIREADEFYAERIAPGSSEDARRVQRQAFAGLVWNRQSYHYDVLRWLKGDSTQPPPDPARKNGRNHDWTHLYNSDVISMPDKWEYPWYASWDLAFHCVATALIDPQFAKDQLVLLLREWYMHPNGELPAYEWNFSDVNPPVHAWAAWRIYKIEARIRGKGGPLLSGARLPQTVAELYMVGESEGPRRQKRLSGRIPGPRQHRHVRPVAAAGTGNFIEQSDSTSWMAMYCLDMLAMATELAREDPAYEDVASKFFEHFIYISRAMNNKCYNHVKKRVVTVAYGSLLHRALGLVQDNASGACQGAIAGTKLGTYKIHGIKAHMYGYCDLNGAPPCTWTDIELWLVWKDKTHYFTASSHDFSRYKLWLFASKLKKA